MEKKNAFLRALPKVDECMSILNTGITEKVPRMLLKKIVQNCIDEERRKILADADGYSPLTPDQWKSLFTHKIETASQPNLRRVINGTGIIIHTNLGRSLLPQEAMNQLVQCGAHYSNLEFDLSTGKRGSRYSLVEDIICDITGAEAALVVNNNAAAVLLVLETLAHGKEAIVSRGELVEIGGSFRIPDVMAKSGATLVEVGATNRTHYRDYEKSITEETALLLKVHTSNFRMLGFTCEVDTEELVKLARIKGTLVMEDLGSGCLLDLSSYGLPRERTVQEVVQAGVDVVTFSGDKLLGGPQAGIIVGKREVISKIKKNPINRALRIDKFTLAALESILRNYYDPERALQHIPTLAMLTDDAATIKKRVQRALRKLRKEKIVSCNFSLVKTTSLTGGGANPAYGIDSWALKIDPLHCSLNTFEKNMRDLIVPLVGRIENDAFLVDFRTILETDINDLVILLKKYFSS